MKEIKEEADRLVELYYQDDKLDECLFMEDAIQCAIIDVSNTIEVLDFNNIMDLDLLTFCNKVKQELENRLNK